MPMSIVLVFFGHKYERERKREKGINRKEALEQKESDSDRDRIKRVSLFHGSHRDPDDPLHLGFLLVKIPQKQRIL